jgi:hypothetical protein
MLGSNGNLLRITAPNGTGLIQVIAPNGIDDSATLAAAIAAVNTSYAAAIPVSIHAVPGVYRITNSQGSMPAFAPGVPGVINGSGIHKTYFQLDASYVGDLFSWSECWQKSSYASGMLPSADTAGAGASGFTVMGNTSSAAQQNVFRFYDRNDYVMIKDVEAFFVNGQFLSIGRTKNQPQAYVRESHFRNLRAHNCGTSSQAAVEISSTTVSGSDATNELQFHGLNLFAAAGKGVVISNPNNFSATRLIRFYGLRIEASGGDNLSIGLASDSGQTALIGLHGLEVSSGLAATWGMTIQTNGTNVPYGIFGTDVIINSLGNGINLSNVNGAYIRTSQLNVSGTNVQTGVGASNYQVLGPNNTYAHNP